MPKCCRYSIHQPINCFSAHTLLRTSTTPTVAVVVTSFTTMASASLFPAFSKKYPSIEQHILSVAFPCLIEANGCLYFCPLFHLPSLLLPNCSQNKSYPNTVIQESGWSAVCQSLKQQYWNFNCLSASCVQAELFHS